jgi:hypothetical protein
MSIMDANRAGEPCPDCGFSTHKAEHDGETWYRCITDSCDRGWYSKEDTDV